MGQILLGHSVSPSIGAFIKDLMGIILAVLLVVSIINTLNMRAASFTTLLTSTNITINVTLDNGLTGFTNKLVVLLFGPFGINSCVRTRNANNAIGRVRVFRAVLTAPSGGVICVPGNSLDDNTIAGFDQRAAHQMS